MMAHSEIPIDGYGDETDAHGHYIGSQPLRAPEPTTPQAPMPDGGREYLDSIQLPATEQWRREGSDVMLGSYVIKVRNYDVWGSTPKEVSLAQNLVNYLNSTATEHELRAENQRLREALATIADTIATVANHE